MLHSSSPLSPPSESAARARGLRRLARVGRVASALLAAGLATCVRRPISAPASAPTPVIVLRPPAEPAAPPSKPASPPASTAPAPAPASPPASTSPTAATPAHVDSTRAAHVPALVAPPALQREFRAAWVTPLYGARGADWPSTPGLSPDSQRAELRSLLDHAQAIGLNAIILHVRIAGDAMYPSPYAPWSAFLTGREGRAPDPAYDPLAYAVEQAHARGLQLHAWFNPFRARYPGTRFPDAASHVTRTHPEWIRRYGEQTWIDPGDPAARAFVLATMLDVVKRYDIDGIHIDDYFYPYRENETIVHRRRLRHHRVRITRTVREIAFPDDRTWRRFGVARGWTDRAAWRRANIDGFVHALYDSVKALKPWVLVGISPFGIWRSGTPAGVTGLDAYAEIYADSRRWLREGWLDYIVPQLYWPLDGEEQRFTRLDAWWRAENVRGRHIWPGLETELTTGGRDPWPIADITNEIAWLRDGHGPSDEGHVHFRFGSLGEGSGSLAEALRDSLYAAPALVPASSWLDDRRPAAPRAAMAGAATLTIAPGDSVPVAWWLVQVETGDGRWTARVVPATTARIDLGTVSARPPVEVAVTALGRTGESSAPALLPTAVALEGAGAR